MKKLTIFILLIGVSFLANAKKYYSVEDTKWLIVVNGGYSRRIAILDKDSMDPVIYTHVKKLLGGFSGSAEAVYFTSKNGGFGFRINDVKTSNDELVTVTYNDGTSASGVMADNIDIMFIGPVGMYRHLSTWGERAFILNYGYGLIAYRNLSTLIDDKYDITGFTTGFMLELGYDFTLTDHLAAGVSLSAISGVLQQLSYTDSGGNKTTKKLDKDSYEGLMHVNLQIGIRVNL